MKAEAEDLGGSSAVAGDLACKDWPFTGQKVRRRTTIENTWSKETFKEQKDVGYSCDFSKNSPNPRFWYNTYWTLFIT